MILTYCKIYGILSVVSWFYGWIDRIISLLIVFGVGVDGLSVGTVGTIWGNLSKPLSKTSPNHFHINISHFKSLNSPIQFQTPF